MSTPRTARAAMPLLAWLITLSLTIWLLSALGHGTLAQPPIAHGWQASASWAGGRDAPTILMATLRVLTLGLAWYLLVTSLLAIAARMTRAALLIRTADKLTLPSVRRLISGTVGVAVFTVPIAPAFAAGPGQAVAARTSFASAFAAGAVPPQSGDPDGGGGRPPRPPPPPPPAPLMTRLAPTPPILAGTWAVLPGESLWSIAASVLSQARGRPPTLSELDTYWRRLVEVNRPNLADPRNADLLFPGQVMIVPAPG